MNKEIHNSHTTLSIRISTDGFCFCSYTASKPDALLYHYHEAESGIPLTTNFDTAWKNCPFAASNKYSELKAIIVTENFTVIPEEYDNSENYDTFYRSCFPNTPSDSHIIANKLTAQGATILFSIEDTLYNKLRQIGEVTFYTPASIVLGFIARQGFDEKRYILAYYHKGKSLILSVIDETLQLSNSFTSSETHNQAFYLLSIWKELQLSQQEDTLYLCGDKSVETITPILKQFIRNTKRLNPNEIFQSNILNRINDTPFDLQALLLCE